MKPHILSIDCGTQSLRGLIFDLKGRLVETAKVQYSPYYSPKPGWAEQSSVLFRESLIKACRMLKEANGEVFNGIRGIGVTAQRDSMVCVDGDGEPLRPVITWLDQRKARPEYRPRGATAFAFKAAGLYQALMKTQSDGKVNWLRQNEAELWERCAKYLQVSGYLNHFLTGAFIDSTASQVGHVPMDYKRRCWASEKSLNRRLFPVEREKLPDLVEPGALIGYIRGEAAEQTGLPRGLPVIACGSDKGCETLAMGVVDEGMASLSFGTTATVQTTSRRYFEPIRFMPAYPAPLPGYWNPEIEIFRGYWMITWFKEQFGYKEIVESKKNGKSPEELLDRLLKEVPAGSMGLMVQPFWSPGLKHPSAKGAMLGFADVHTRAYVYRAMIEGLAYALRDGLRSLEQRGGRKVERAAVSGGAGRSDEICRISADIFGLPIVRGRTWETSGLGAAIVSAVGLGHYADFHEAVKEMVSYKETFYPRKEYRELYDKLFEIYRKIFPTMKGLYREIGRTVGYPEMIGEA